MLTFTKGIPEETGIFSTSIHNFIKRLQDKEVPMHSFLLLHREKLIAEFYYAPYTADSLHRMFSISKSVTAIAIGLLQDEGKLSISDKICDYFPEYVTEHTHPWILNMTIRNMLMMETCHAATTYKLDLTSDWVASFFTTPPTHAPGKLFHYDTSSAHTLCALVEKLSGTDMLSYIKEKLAPLGLSSESYMLKDPFGVSMGGSGLVAKPMDLLKIGYFLLHNGSVPLSTEKEQGSKPVSLLSESYVKEATSNLVSTKMTAPLPSEACGYGYQIWQNQRGGFVCYGMGGQLVILLPEHDLICVTTADTQGMAGGNQLIYDALYEEIVDHISDTPLPIPQDSSLLASSVKDELQIKPLSGPVRSSYAEKVNKNVFRLEKNPQGFSDFSVEFLSPKETSETTFQSGILHYTLHGQKCQLVFGLGNMQQGTFPTYEMNYCASGEWLSEDTLYIRAHIIDAYVGSVRFELIFGEHDLTVFIRKIEESLFQEFNGHLYGVSE